MKPHEQIEWTPLFNAWRKRVDALIQEHPLQIISWEATRRCNLKCHHCGSPSEAVDCADELTTDEVISAFDQIAFDFDMSQFRHINITGGEPFVRKDLAQILRTLQKYPFYRNIDIQTNGTAIADHPEFLDELHECGVTGLGVSIDGFEDAHDTLRGVPGSWAKAVQAATTAVKKNYTVTVSFVAHAGNVHELPAFHDFAKREIKPRVFRVMFVDRQGRAAEHDDCLLSAGLMQQVLIFLKREYELACSTYADPRTTMVELGCGGWLGTDLEGRVRPFIFHCIAGLINLGILYDGKLGSCSNISRDFIEGDLRKERIRDVWELRYQRYRNFDWRNAGDCVECDQWQYCHGGPMHLQSTENRVTSSCCLMQYVGQLMPAPNED